MFSKVWQWVFGGLNGPQTLIIALLLLGYSVMTAYGLYLLAVKYLV